MEDVAELLEELFQESDEIIFRKLNIRANTLELEVSGVGSDTFPTDLLVGLVEASENKLLFPKK
ncbi:MAG: hypothetical protein ACTSRG_19695 [Candidatus Helarchaeota archaeon]